MAGKKDADAPIDPVQAAICAHAHDESMIAGKIEGVIGSMREKRLRASQPDLYDPELVELEKVHVLMLERIGALTAVLEGEDSDSSDDGDESGGEGEKE